MSVNGEVVQEMKFSFPQQTIARERMDLPWTAEESYHEITRWCVLKREREVRKWRQHRDNKYSPEEFSYKAMLAGPRKELAGVGVERKDLKTNLIGHIR